jgi:hypothetical protein
MWKLSAEGKPTHLGSGAAPCWSPDDQQIAFFQDETNPAGARPGAWIMNSDDEQRAASGSRASFHRLDGELPAGQQPAK